MRHNDLTEAKGATEKQNRVRKMTNLEIAQMIANEIESFKKNEIIMDFVTKEAREKVAAEIRQEMKGGTTAKAVELLEMRYPNIKARVEDYVNAGLFGVFLKSLDVAA